MKYRTTLISFLILIIPCHSKELIWEYKTGWTKGFVVTLDSKTNKISYLDRKTGKTNTKALVNAENVIIYLEVLLEKISKEDPGKIVFDGAKTTITYTVNKKKITQEIRGVLLPSSVYLQEGVSAKVSLETAKTFKKRGNTFLIQDMFDQIVEKYFPES